jgi:NitT/TauT family transport system ATP-binding protein
MSKEILRVSNVSKNFAQKTTHRVLENIDITINKGEFVCILGPSGCGKTVLLYLVAGFSKPTNGEITFDGKMVDSPGTDRILIFQDSVLFPWMTVYYNIMFGLEKSILPLEEKEMLAYKYIEMVGLTKFKDWYTHHLSGGMKQRVAIARALISDPKILLMDEPFSVLDSQNRKYMRKNLEKIWEKTGKTILFVTHSVNEAIDLADTIYVFTSLPTKIKKVYHIDLPRPRDQHSPKFVELSKNIEIEIAEEFQKTVTQDTAGELVLESVPRGFS